MSGRKISNNLENPIDNFFINISEIIAPKLVEVGFTPNIITTFSFISALYGIYLVHKERYILGAFFFMLNYFFDCLDGYMARKFNMISKFGDLYDHYTDWISVLLLVYVYFQKNNLHKKFKIFIIVIFSIFIFLGAMHIGCQEKYYELLDKKNSKNGILSNLKFLCFKKDNIKFTRFFGLGTTVSVIVLIIAFTPLLNTYFK